MWTWLGGYAVASVIIFAGFCAYWAWQDRKAQQAQAARERLFHVCGVDDEPKQAA